LFLQEIPCLINEIARFEIMRFPVLATLPRRTTPRASSGQILKFQKLGHGCLQGTGKPLFVPGFELRGNDRPTDAESRPNGPWQLTAPSG
jgi:hypothetical protein